MSPTADHIVTQSAGVGASGVADQYADGKAAKVNTSSYENQNIYNTKHQAEKNNFRVINLKDDKHNK